MFVVYECLIDAYLLTSIIMAHLKTEITVAREGLLGFMFGTLYHLSCYDSAKRLCPITIQFDGRTLREWLEHRTA